MEYDLQILGTKWEKKAGVWGWASGINQQGQVAGTAIVSLDTPAGYLNGPAIWDPRKKNWPTSPMTPYSPKSYVPGQLFKITSVGNVTMAVGVIGDKAGYAQVPAVVGGALPPILDLSAIGEPEDINNSSVVVGNGSARSFFFKTSPREKTVHWLSPFSGCKGINRNCSTVRSLC